MDEKIEIKVFNGHEVRLKWDSDGEDYLCAIVDMISLITETEDPINYWSKIKNIEKQHGVDLSNLYCTLKIPNLDGEIEETDFTDALGILRIVQSIPSPKAEPVKDWIAENGKRHYEELENPDLILENAIDNYKKLGYSDQWISQKLNDFIKNYNFNQ